MPSEIVSQISNAFKVANTVIDYLNHSGISFDKSAILDYDSKLLQFRYGLQLGAKNTRTEDFVRKVKSKLARNMEIDAVKPPEVITLPNFEDVSSYLTTRGSHTMINLAGLLENISSETVVIEFVQELSEHVRDALFPIPHSFRNPIYRQDKLVEIPIEMITDFGSFWYKPYDSFIIRNVKREGGLHYLEKEVLQLFPDKMTRIIECCRSAKSLNSQMMQQLNQISTASMRFGAFANESEVKEQLARAVTTDKPKNVNILGVRGTIREMDIRSRKLKIPHEIIYTVTLELEGKELAISAKIFVDIAKVDQIIRNLANEIF